MVNTWATLINSYWPLLVVAGLASQASSLRTCLIVGTGVVMSYVYLTLLRFRAAMLVQTGMLILVMAPLTTGAYYVWCWKRDGECWGGTGGKLGDGMVAVAAIIIGLTFMTMSWHLQPLALKPLGVFLSKP